MKPEALQLHDPHATFNASPVAGRAARARFLPAALALALGAAAAGCAVPVASGLDEGDANRIVMALDRTGIEATKEADPGSEGKFRVSVAKHDGARAMATLQGEELPRPKAPGVLDTVSGGALVPSASQEHAQLVAGLAGDLARTLEGVDGVLSARVHLNIPAPDPFASAPAAKSTASVLIEHRGTAPPLSEGAIARLVAGGVPGLSAGDVAVVMVLRPAPPRAAGLELTHVGPIAVAHESMRLLQASLAALLALVAALTATTLALFARVRKIVRQASDAEGEPDATHSARRMDAHRPREAISG